MAFSISDRDATSAVHYSMQARAQCTAIEDRVVVRRRRHTVSQKKWRPVVDGVVKKLARFTRKLPAVDD